MGMKTAEEAIRAYLSCKKTPYQLDLEVKDRKPDIVPKVGDKVKIKSREWYEKWKNEIGSIRMDTTSCSFIDGMSHLCGEVLTVRKVTGEGGSKRWTLGEDYHFWVSEFFEEVYPVQEQLSSKFPKIDLSCHLPLETPSQENKGELIVHQVDSGSMIEKTLKRLAVYSLVQGLDAKPKLKQIKTTHLIKLKKL